ncbi:hypothetical protein [Bacillus amyloliquefaciens]|uniref:Uncharacterized protein n=1 Tax=Bacillus amyloliquefaciens TaxID=1390 RepID=A0AAP7TB05_BACAM|nr:hypothetical protein [Bacillus amyloliquefaciens]OIK20934.1 hypothetical protein BKP66_15090 [Bacillus amyloliquefaciens]
MGIGRNLLGMAICEYDVKKNTVWVDYFIRNYISFAVLCHNEIKTTTTSTNQEEVSDSDSYNKTNVETEPYKPKYDTETYDIYAYRLLTRTVKERKGRSEYVYGGYAVSKTTAETYSIKTSAFTSKDDKDFSFWRFDVDFVPIKGAIVVVKFPKGDHEKYYDISQVSIQL